MGLSGWKVLRAAVPAVALTLVGASTAQATTIGPDAFGYRATDEIPFVFQNIAATGSRVMEGFDDGFFTAPIGFSFSFYGASFASVSISSNGLLTFGGSNPSFFNVNLETDAPSADLPSIAPFWDDLTFAAPGTDAVYYQTIGAPGNRAFIVQWNQVDHFRETTSSATFQAILSESGAILFNYSSLNFGTTDSNGASATVGIRNTDGHLNGNRLQWSFNQAVLRGEQSILFAPAAPVPEPTAMLLLGTGLIGFAARARRRRS